MTVREFNGTSDLLTCGVGAASGMTYGTLAILFKFSTITGFRSWGALHNSGGTFLANPLGLTDFTNYETFSGASVTYATPPTTSIWYLAVVRKATGTATPRLSTYDYNSTTWTHRNAGGTVGDWTAPGASGNIQFSFQASSDFFGGRVAARALWSNTLPWSADTSGDTSLESAGLEDAATNWLSASPTAFWLFNQSSTATPVDDLSTAGTADQTSITGTTVINGDDPPGFNFSLAAQAVALQAAQAFPAF